MNRVKRFSFVVRVVQDRRGEISGVIERVATGAKEPFSGVEAIGQVMVRMLPGERGGRVKFREASSEEPENLRKEESNPRLVSRRLEL
jgi:hypothetical protein